MTASTRRSRWLVGRLPDPAVSAAALVIIPPGSAGPEAAAGWLDQIQAVDVIIVQLPGRGQRLFEQPITDLVAAAEAVTAELAALLPARYALLGHCSGAYVALELAHQLAAAGRPASQLFLSSSRTPAGLSEPDSEQSLSAQTILAMTDQQLLESLIQRGHLPAGPIDAEISAAMISAHRAAVRAGADYRCTRPPLAVPTEIWRGTEDDVIADSHARAWQPYIRTDITIVEFPGARTHFEQPTEAALDRVRTRLTGNAAQPGENTAGLRP